MSVDILIETLEIVVTLGLYHMKPSAIGARDLIRLPSRLPEMCIKLHGIKKGMVVLDPFIGLGSTAIAALQLGASCVGFDIDEKYLEFCVNRVKDFHP